MGWGALPFQWGCIMCLLPQAKQRTKTAEEKKKSQLITKLPRAREPQAGSLEKSQRSARLPVHLHFACAPGEWLLRPSLPAPQHSDPQGFGWTGVSSGHTEAPGSFPSCLKTQSPGPGGWTESHFNLEAHQPGDSAGWPGATRQAEALEPLQAPQALAGVTMAGERCLGLAW